MELRYKLENADGYLIAKITGEWHVEPTLSLLDALINECQSRNCNRLLADFLQVEIVGIVLSFERYLFGEHLGAKLGSIRLAALFPAEQIDKFAESIAVAAGAEFLVTADRAEAVRWLTDGSAESGGR